MHDMGALRPFFMTIVSSTNHWMFISSNGGLSAGRKDADSALFPYYTDDKITESAEFTGSKSIFRLHREDTSFLWEPFSTRQEGRYKISRHLYKNVAGSKIIFEEVNHSLKVLFRYQWSTSDKYGFIRKSTLLNQGNASISIDVLDGLQNILPACVDSGLQQGASNLVDAYKRSELAMPSGVGIYALSAIIVDKAEPSEALKANICWSAGLPDSIHLLSSLQLNNFRNSLLLSPESDIKAEKGAYFVSSTVRLEAHSDHQWLITADVNKTHTSVASIIAMLGQNQDIVSSIEEDIEVSNQRLSKMVAAADGLQRTSEVLKDARHFSNCLFNIMRGGIFDQNYLIHKSDLSSYLTQANQGLNQDPIASLPPTFPLQDLQAQCALTDDPDLKRLLYEYLPLRFSRRHGDPSRPWNRFSINTQRENDGAKILDFEGNWRDIFQNWEALLRSYPEFVDGILFKFLNASTADGYNPYRITKGGIDWEIIEPDDPWAYIGYWGDHQLIYLLKLLEHAEDHYPGKLESYFDQDIFVFSHVPYRIKSYQELLVDPKNTVDFDHDSDLNIRQKMADLGSDGALLTNQSGSIIRVNFIEKILITILAKVSNFIPEGGIWMNTQRPEWNDANNALVGNGVSMVTLCYLNRFLSFLIDILDPNLSHFSLSTETSSWLSSTIDTLSSHRHLLDTKITDERRKDILDALGKAGSHYRESLYTNSFGEDKVRVSYTMLIEFVNLLQPYTQHTIDANKRSDGLYHSYNLMSVANDSKITIKRLDPMLEGQVAVLSSGHLSTKQALSTLDALRSSTLYRSNQQSYLLYPNKQLPGFLNKNIVTVEQVHSSQLLTHLREEGNTEIIEQDVNGLCHFNANFRNVSELRKSLDKLADGEHHDLARKERGLLEEIYEEVFDHKSFTGRSGTFYGYEGLGSIYWHMVSKLLLSVEECIHKSSTRTTDKEYKSRLITHFHEINAGIGVHKSPEIYGAFPTDAYSHTPAGKGAQQPGMTGQVKEDILSRFGELGIIIADGKIHFHPTILKREEFIDAPSTFKYIDIHGKDKQLQLPEHSLAFTLCQVPIVYTLSDDNRLQATLSDGNVVHLNEQHFDTDLSAQVFQRSGKVSQVVVAINIAHP